MTFPLRHPISLAMRFAAILLAIIAQTLLHKQLILSIVLWAVAFVLLLLPSLKSQNPAIPNIHLHPIFPEKIEKTGLVLGGVAVGLSALSFYLFSTDAPNKFAWIFHLLSVLLIILSFTFFCSSPKKITAVENHWHWLEISALLIVFFLAVFLRFYKLTSMPFGLWFDEADNGLNALTIFNDLENVPVFASSTHLPAQLIYLIAFSIKLFGQNVFSIRLVSALFGVGTVAAAFLAGKEMFNRRVGIALAFLLAVSRWDLIWSHIGMHGITVPFFELLTFGLVLRAFRLQRYRDYLFAGLSLGLGLCFYVPFRAFPIIIIGLFVLAWFSHPRMLPRMWRHLLVFLFGAFVISVPVSQFAIFHADEFWGRINQASIFKDRSFEEGFNATLENTREHLLIFNYAGDRNGRHNLPSAPMLDHITAALFILGIVSALIQIKKPYSLLSLFWLLFMLAPGIFSFDFESPQTLRVIGSLPAACILAVVPIHVLLEDQKQIIHKKSNFLFFSLLGFLFILITVGNTRQYFKVQANNDASWLDHSTPDTIIAHKMNHYGSDVHYFVSTFYFNTPTLRYLAPEIQNYQSIETHDTFPFLISPAKEAVFFIDRDRRPVFDQLKQNYPNALFAEHKTPSGQPALFEVYLTQQDIQSIQGVTAKIYSDPEMTTAPFRIRSIDQLDGVWTMDFPGPLPFYADFSGALFAPAYGEYQFRIESPAEVEFYLDGHLVLVGNGGISSGTIELARGLHNLEIKATGAYGNFNISWKPPDAEMQPITSEYLFQPVVATNGLLGTFYPNADWQEPASIKQIDPFLHYYYHNPPLPRPYTVKWEGRIFIETPGEYEFGLESIDTSQLILDGNLLVDNQTLNQYQGNKISLDQGFHEMQILFSDLTGSTHINFYWKPPNSDLVYVPSDVLFLPE